MRRWCCERRLVTKRAVAMATSPLEAQPAMLSDEAVPLCTAYGGPTRCEGAETYVCGGVTLLNAAPSIAHSRTSPVSSTTTNRPGSYSIWASLNENNNINHLTTNHWQNPTTVERLTPGHPVCIYCCRVSTHHCLKQHWHQSRPTTTIDSSMSQTWSN